ncbi:Glutaminyl-tRNA synthetase [Tribonema minus]|uniref:glutamine--tRNA ligase n=1 Tax=Tribonema minus TaxID=303371 RepID=A0A835Z3U2_9STRA|nr:Glutaminyl-tRNA synthetase [Tribonema minus]
MKDHLAKTGGKVRTRFPPEPNGYLHIGHAKSMNMNFKGAFDKLGVAEDMRQTIFRYDDTNPEAESQEYIDSLREDVSWLGWTPVETTFSSDNFQQLYDYAVQLIKEGKAYVCHQTKDDISRCRDIAKAKIADPNTPGDPNSPWRERPREENLRLFGDMRKGKLEENAATLRLKMDMTSSNPNMWDQIAYRIRYTPHPHAGDNWCIYPTYDYTHCIVDSIEHIDYSICTLEFESRRESYYWLLEALNIYRPKVYEFARLNITYTVLSKRRLLKLVKQGLVRGWDDPRMPTIKSLRRRGYTAEALNAFCTDIGVSRNETIIEVERLTYWARTLMNDTAPRAMACLEPILVTITNLPEVLKLSAPLLPMAPEKGSREILLGSSIYIDSTDFREQDSKDYFGLAPGKLVGLKYAGLRLLRCDKVVKTGEDGTGTVKELICSLVDIAEDAKRPKGTLSWVPFDSAVKAEIRLYNHLFTVPEPDANWEQQLNLESEVVMPNAVVDSSVLGCAAGSPFQFERLGFFVVDRDSGSEAVGGKMVFNRTVTLRDGAGKAEAAAASGAAAPATRSRKEEQMAQLAAKEAMKKIPPQDMFRNGPDADKYSAYDADGVPTHAADGEPISKSAFKKLKKEWEKHKKVYQGQ